MTSASNISGIPLPRGDANGDGIVNAQDIAVIASEWLQTGTNLLGDVNNDAIVNAQDIAVIASHWLQTSGGAATGTAVPEPSAVLLAGAGAWLLAALRRHGGL